MVVPTAMSMAIGMAISSPRNRHVVMVAAASGMPYDMDDAEIGNGVKYAMDSAKDADIFEMNKKVTIMLAKKSRFLVLSRWG